MRLSKTPRKGKCTTSMAKMLPKWGKGEEIYSTCSSGEVAEKAGRNKCRRSRPPREPSKSLLRISTMGIFSKSPTSEPDVVKNAGAREVRTFRNARLARAREELSRCIKWDQECTSRFRKHVINVKEKGKLSEKEENVKLAKEGKFWKNKKFLKFQSKRVSRMVLQLN